MKTKIITSQKWHLEGKWRICPLFIAWQNEGVCKSLFDTFSTSSKPNNPTILTVNGRDSYVSENERKKIIIFLSKETKKDLNFLQKHIDLCTEAVQNLLEVAYGIQKTNITKISHQELAKKFTSFSKNFIELMPFLMTFDYLGDVLETLVRDELKKIFPKHSFSPEDFDKHLAILTRCLEETSPTKESNDLYKIGEKMQKVSRVNFQKALNDSGIAELLEKHQQVYSWMKVYSFLGTPFLKSDYVNRLQEMYEEDFADILKQKINNFRKNQKEWQNIQKIYQKEAVLIRKAKLTQQFIFMRAHRFEMMNLAYFLVNNLFREISNRIGLSDYTDTIWLLSNEILEALRKNSSQDLLCIIEERKKGFTSFGSNKENFIVTGNLHAEIVQFFKKNSADDFDTNIKKVTGQTAFRGSADGTVKIVFTANDLKKVKKGDILVAKMTNADLVAGLEKASAFVTDEGGILCHAAIVSREMQKPCVIGTKNATEVFRDGDKVMVNADKGEVILCAKEKPQEKKMKKNIAIVSFEDLDIFDTDIAGGKGASLGEMTNSGIPVPPGIVVTALVFDDFLSKNNLVKTLQSLINNKEDFDTTSHKIRTLIENQIFIGKYQKELLEKLQLFPSDFYAVRSSATAEDGSENSFAGQLDTFLNITPDNIPDMVKQCWGSLFSPRALFYQKNNNIDQSNVSVAVVVQKMIDSQISGITFTANPINKDTSEMVIEAGYGLGEAIVSGQITPDDYILKKENLSILQKNVQTQKEKIVRYANKSETRKVVKNLQDKQKLTNEQIIELAKICLHVEKVYQKPMDIEWAFDGERFFITQARPITTL